MSVLKDTIRNIKKSLILDFILLVQFASCFFASTYLLSYYFNIEETENLYEKQMDKNMYWIFLENSVLENSKEALYEAKECIKELRASDKFDYMLISLSGALYLDAEDCQKHMTKKERIQFQLNDAKEGAFYDAENDVKWTPDMQCVTVDWKGFQYLNKSLKEGREFAKSDFTRNSPNEKVPIMLGANYEPYYQIGECVRCLYNGDARECEIIGFLDKNSNANLSVQTYLDSYILFPSQDREYDLTEGMSLFSEMYHYSKCFYAWIITDSDFPQNRLTQELNDIMSKYPSLGSLGGEPQTFGTEAFKGELKETVDMVAALVGIWLLFLVFTVFMILLHKIDVREREYAILLMNGIPYGDIIKSYLLELGIFLIGAVMTTFIWQPVLRENIGKMNFAAYYAGILLGAAALVLLLAGIVLWIRFQKMDIEQLMRGRE